MRELQIKGKTGKKDIPHLFPFSKDKVGSSVLHLVVWLLECLCVFVKKVLNKKTSISLFIWTETHVKNKK